MDSFNKENIIINQEDISTPLRHKSSRHTVSSSPLRDRSLRERSINNQSFFQTQKESFILPDNENDEMATEEQKLQDHEEKDEKFKILERQYASVLLKLKSMELETQSLEMELLLKEKELLQKSTKLNELVIENKNLDKSLQQEIKSNELNYSKWLSLKQQFETKIANLNSYIQKNVPRQKENYNEMINIQVLNKKLKSLQSDFELERNSKMLIIDEFEILKQNYLNLELNYNLLQIEHEKIKAQGREEMGEDEYEDGSHNLADCSFDSDSSYGDDRVEHIYSNESVVLQNAEPALVPLQQPQQPARTTIADELSNTKFQYNQELVKLNFQIKSLNLQNEKLYSYIGYLLQNSINDKEYSDAKLIRIAKKNLVNNKILRSVSSSLGLHLTHRSVSSASRYQQDHATQEEMSIFLNDCYGANSYYDGSGVDEVKRKVYNIKSTANLKKLHIRSNNSSLASNTIEEEAEGDADALDQEEQERLNFKNLKISILTDLLIGNKMILNKLNLNDVLFNGLLEFINSSHQYGGGNESYGDGNDLD